MDKLGAEGAITDSESENRELLHDMKVLQLHCTHVSITHRLEMCGCDFVLRKLFSSNLIYFVLNAWIITLISMRFFNLEFNLGDSVK